MTHSAQSVANQPEVNPDLVVVPNHQRLPRLADVELFAAPPAEIGQVISAESSLKAGQQEMPAMKRMSITLLISGAVGMGILFVPHRASSDNLMLGLAVVAALITAAIVRACTGFKHTCSFVGQDGAARFTLKGKREAQPTLEVVRFNDAADLRASQTRQFVNGVYSGTDYDYRWNDAQGLPILRLNGRYHGKDKPPKPGDAFHFVSAAEVAWSVHILDRAQKQLEAEGSIAFPVDHKRTVRVGPGFLEFHFGGEPVRVTRDDIASVSLGGGTFSFKHNDAKWYSSAGKYNFQYGQMANAKVFLFALDKLMGYRWG